MNRIEALRSVGDAERADLSEEAVIDGSPFYSGKATGGPATTGRPAYQDEYMRDHGPDSDEWLTGPNPGRKSEIEALGSFCLP
jgi:hypothetical protein